MQLVSQNFSLDDDVARLPDSRGAVDKPAVDKPGQALRRLLAHYERITSQEAFSIEGPVSVVALSLDNDVTPLVRFETTRDFFMPDSTRPLFCSSTHAPGIRM